MKPKLAKFKKNTQIYLRMKYLLIVLTILTYGCEKNTTITFQDDVSLVINSFFIPDSNLRVNISESLSMTSNRDVSFRNDMLVNIYENNHLLGVMKNVENGNYTLDFKPKAGEKYSIQTQVKGFEDCFAEDIIPPLVKILKYDTSQIENKLIANIEFKDPDNMRNYYLLEFRVKKFHYLSINGNKPDTTFYTESSSFTCDDPLIEGELNAGDGFFYGFYFSDEKIDGKTIRLPCELYLNQIKSFNIYLKSISYNYYMYAKSYEKFLNTDLEMAMFSEPLPMYSNISNGFGIFAGYQQDSVSITLAD